MNQINKFLLITENIRNTIIKRNLLVESNKHYNYILKIQRGDINFIDLMLEPFELIEYIVPIGSLEYKKGDTLDIIAQPNFGWVFDYWTVNDTILENKNTELMYIIPNYNVNIVAHFKKQ